MNKPAVTTVGEHGSKEEGDGEENDDGDRDVKDPGLATPTEQSDNPKKKEAANSGSI